MNRLLVIIATGLLACVLTACDRDNKPADTSTTVVVPANGSDTTKPEAMHEGAKTEAPATTTTTTETPAN